jgi:uncharacterized protein (TIRG00374 family)
MNEQPINLPAGEVKKKKKGKWKYFLSIGIVLVLTAISLIFSLISAGGNIVDGAKIIWDALKDANIYWLIGILGISLFAYVIDGIIILVFARLYTRHYKFHQGFANTLIGAFYSAVTPGASGGQVMQVYTMKKQGIEVSNAASIMVMWFILYQSNLILFDVVAIIVEWNLIMSLSSFNFTWTIGSWNISITLLPLIIIGFILNLSALAMLFLMSYSHRFHNFVMHYLINFGAKLHLVKNPDKARENLRVQVENFKIELRRLQSNIPVTLLISFLFILTLFVRYSIPYWSGFSLNAVGAFNWKTLFDTCFLSAFHQMVTGIFPLPGGAGVSELFFRSIFQGIIDANKVDAVQIIWRTATFHIIVIISGFVAALYRSRPVENFQYANRQTFVNLQLETYEVRKVSADTLYETKQLSRKDIQKKLHNWTSKPLPKKNKSSSDKTSGTKDV